jgi:putative ABC transport system substrate-binding protein
VLAAPLAAQAQQAGPPARIAVVFGHSPLATMMGPEPSNPNMRAFLEGLRELGYIEGKNIVVQRRALEGRMDQVPAVIGELLKVEVILAAGLPVAVAPQRVSPTIPLVVVDATYEGPDRIADSLARPGGNVTGLSGGSRRGPEKVLELLKEAVPRAARNRCPDRKR